VAQTLSQEGAGSESIEVAEADPAIDAGAPEVGRRSIPMIERRAAPLNFDHGLRTHSSRQGKEGEQNTAEDGWPHLEHLCQRPITAPAVAGGSTVGVRTVSMENRANRTDRAVGGCSRGQGTSTHRRLLGKSGNPPTGSLVE
jgi:hypothetical protein